MSTTVDRTNETKSFLLQGFCQRTMPSKFYDPDRGGALEDYLEVNGAAIVVCVAGTVGV